MPSTFASVKLSSALVDEARVSAQPLRRSVADQIEHWATLGRVVEHSGLTVQEAQAAIAAYESAAAGGARAQAVADLRQRIRATSGDGTLATHVRGVVESDRSSAGSA